MLLAKLSPPYTYSWDTTSVPEDGYQLVAQMDVGGQILASAPVTVVVDRTPPTIISRTPDSGASNVSLTDPIQVVFSEALAPASVTATAVALALGDSTVAGVASLGSDGRTVRVGISNLDALALPGAMTETATTTITDLAGNAFVGASWMFSVPQWVDLGSVNGGHPQMVLDSSGAPIIGTIVASGSTSQLLIAKHTAGTSWETSIPSPQVGTTLTEFSLAINKSNELFVAWDEAYAAGAVTPILVARWNGTSWDRSYGELLHTSGAAAERPAIALTSNEQPVVRWAELISVGEGPDYVSRWNGSGWVPYSGVSSGDCDMLPCRIVVDSSDDPIIETSGQISRWTGSSWTTPVDGRSGLALNSAQQAITFQSTGTSIQVLGISTTGAVTNYVPVLGTSPVQSSGIPYGQIAIGSNDTPTIVWFQYDGGTASSPTNPNLHVAHWTGATWDQAYGTLDDAQGAAAVVLAQGTTPIVAWTDASAGTVHVSKSNH